MNAILKLILQENNDKGNNKPSSYNFLLILLAFKSFCGDILSHFNVQIWEQPIGQTLSYKKKMKEAFTGLHIWILVSVLLLIQSSY